jgi:hypothetical protein
LVPKKPVLGVGRLHEARHDHLGGVVADRQVVGEVLGDLIAILRPLQFAQALVAGQLQPGARRRVLRGLALALAGPGLHRLHRLGDLRLGRFEACLRLMQDLQGHHLGLLPGAAEIHIGLEDSVLPFDLVAGVLGHIQIGRLDLVEARGDVAAGHLHPQVPQALDGVDLTVGQLIDHRLGVVANGIEGLGDDLVALADLHGPHLLANHLVEQRRLVERAGDQ